MPTRKPSKKGDPLINAVVDRRWQVLDQLGSGGMGVVYRAERVKLGKQVALKFLHQSVAESKAAVQRFEREAKAISRLHHVNCISILDFGVFKKQPYIVMEFVQGRQLSELTPETLTPNRAVAFIRQVLLGLSHAHSRGVIHRDLKLSNVMLVEMTGTEEMIKILDFGLARISGVDEELSLTAGMIAGTPSYMSPEQAQGKKSDHRSDIYSAGVMLYVLCTGKRPFVAAGTTELLKLQINEAPVPPRRAAPAKRISDGLERVILRAMEKKPAARFQTVTEFLAALDDTQEGQETLTPTVARERKPGRRWRLYAIAAAVCVALGAAGALSIRAYVLSLRAQAVGAYQRWTGPSAPPAGPSAPPRSVAAKPAPMPPPTVATPVKEPAKEIVKEPPKESVKEPPKESVKEPLKEPAKEIANEPAKAVAKESAPPPVAPDPGAGGKPAGMSVELPDPPEAKLAKTPTPPEAKPAKTATPLEAKPAKAPTPPEAKLAKAPTPSEAKPAKTPAPSEASTPLPLPPPPLPALPPRAKSTAPRPPLAHDAREWRQQIDALISDGKVNAAKNQLRDHIAVDKSDGWAHLRLGDVYADAFHYRRDAFREWDSALALEPALDGDAAFRKSLCEAVDGSDHAPAQEFLHKHFADETPALLMPCIRAAVDATRIENAAQLIEAVAGAERPELGMAALRVLDVGKTCAQKKAAVDTIRRLHYLRARGALVKLDRQRLAHKGHEPPTLACFGNSIADTIELLK
jgi:hypothetical protein